MGAAAAAAAAVAPPEGLGVRAVGARGPAAAGGVQRGAPAAGRSRHGVPGAAAAPAGRVGRAHRRLVPRPGAEQVHQQLPPLPVAVPAAAAPGPAPGEWGVSSRGDVRMEGRGGKPPKPACLPHDGKGWQAVILKEWG